MLRLDDVIFTVDFKPYNSVIVKPCIKDTWDLLLSIIMNKITNPRDIIECTRKICGDSMPCGSPLTGSCRVFLVNYYNIITQYCKAHFTLYSVPQHFEVRTPDEEQKEDLKLQIITYEERLVHEHTGLNFREIAELDILQYKCYLADAVKYNILHRIDGEGVKYLNECYEFMLAELNDIDDDEEE